MTVANVKYKDEFPQQKWQNDLQQDKEKLKTAINYIGYLYNGTDAQVKTAVDFFNGFSTSQQIARDKNGVSITYADGRKKDVTFKSGNDLKFLEDFGISAAPALLGDDIDIGEVKKGMIKLKGQPFNANAIATSTTTPKKSEYETYGENVSSNSIKAQTAIQGTEADAATRLTDLYGAYGFSFAAAADKKSQVTVTAPNKKTMIIKVNTNSTDAAPVAKSLSSFIKGNGTSESIVAGNRLLSGGELDQ
jgi:hypothetical protein